MCVRACVHAFVCVHACACMCVEFVCACVRVCTYVCVRVLCSACAHTCMQVCLQMLCGRAVAGQRARLGAPIQSPSRPGKFCKKQGKVCKGAALPGIYEKPPAIMPLH